MRKLQDTRNLLHVEAVVDLIELLFRSVQSFRDKLFLITEALRLGILNALEKVEMRICQREYQHRQAIVNSVYIEGFQLRSGQKLDLHRLKDLMKSQKLSSHEIQPKLKKVLKTVKNHVEQFRSYRNGKISFKVSHKQNYQSLKDNGANKEGKIASDQ